MKRFRRLLQKLIIVTMLLGGVGSLADYTSQPQQTVTAARRHGRRRHVRKYRRRRRTRRRRTSRRKRRRTNRRTNRKVVKKSKRVHKIKQSRRSVAQTIQILSRSPKATVYINIPKKMPDYALAQEAMTAWNNTGAFTFEQTNNVRQARILVMAGIWPNADWAGLTKIPEVKYGYLYGSEIRLNDYYLLMYDHQIDLDVAEHEFGHAIGLVHDTKEKSVMNPVINPDDASSIQSVDVQAVKDLYHEDK